MFSESRKRRIRVRCAAAAVQDRRKSWPASWPASWPNIGPAAATSAPHRKETGSAREKRPAIPHRAPLSNQLAWKREAPGGHRNTCSRAPKTASLDQGKTAIPRRTSLTRKQESRAFCTSSPLPGSHDIASFRSGRCRVRTQSHTGTRVRLGPPASADPAQPTPGSDPAPPRGLFTSLPPRRIGRIGSASAMAPPQRHGSCIR